MATLFTDDFNRADSSDLGTNWAEDNGNPAILTNRLRIPSDGGSAWVARTTTTAHAAAADVKVTVVIVTGTGADGGPVARKSATAGTFYALDIYHNGSSWRADIYRYNASYASAAANVAGANITHVAGDTYRFEVQGTALRAYRNGSLIVSGTDATISAAGQTGCHAWSTVDFDDFQAEDFAGGAKAPPPRRRPWRFSRRPWVSGGLILDHLLRGAA